MPLELVLAAVVAPLVFAAFAVVQQRYLLRARLTATRQLAESLRAELAQDATLRPGDTPHREGLWQLDCTLHGLPVCLWIGHDSLLISVRLPVPPDFQLLPTSAFTRPGGQYDDPADPHRTLDTSMLGPGWSVRGTNAEHHAATLALALRQLLQAAPDAPWIVDGNLRTHHPIDDIEVLADWARTLAARAAGR